MRHVGVSVDDGGFLPFRSFVISSSFIVDELNVYVFVAFLFLSVFRIFNFTAHIKLVQRDERETERERERWRDRK